MNKTMDNNDATMPVIELTKDQKIKRSIHSFQLTKINKAIDSLRVGNIEGRAIIVP